MKKFLQMATLIVAATLTSVAGVPNEANATLTRVAAVSGSPEFGIFGDCFAGNSSGGVYHRTGVTTCTNNGKTTWRVAIPMDVSSSTRNVNFYTTYNAGTTSTSGICAQAHTTAESGGIGGSLGPYLCTYTNLSNTGLGVVPLPPGGSAHVSIDIPPDGVVYWVGANYN